MYSPIDREDEYVSTNDDIPASANEGRCLSDVARYRQSQMRLKSTAKRALGSSSLSSSSEQRSFSYSSSTGSFGAETNSHFTSFDSQSSRGSCSSLPATRQRSSLAKTRWLLPRGKLSPRRYHQYFVSAVFSVRMMHQDLKMSRLSSDSSMDSPRKLSSESLLSKGSKSGRHPRNKMLRSQSASAIDVSMVKPIKGGKIPSAGGDEKGIVVSNDDLLKILSEAHMFVPPQKQRRHKTSVSSLGTTPESIQEIDSDIKEAFENRNLERKSTKGSPEKEGAKLKGKRPNARISRHSSLRVDLPDRQPIVKSRSRAVDVLQVSPVKGSQEQKTITPSNLNKTCLIPPQTSTIRKRQAYGSTLPPRCPSPSELEPMLKSDDNGNQLIEEDEEEADMMEEKQIQPEQSTSGIIETIKEETKTSSDVFDPSLLGEAIERHLSIQKNTSPSKSGKKTRNGAALWKGIWNHDKLGNVLNKLPSRKHQLIV